MTNKSSRFFCILIHKQKMSATKIVVVYIYAKFFCYEFIYHRTTYI